MDLSHNHQTNHDWTINAVTHALSRFASSQSSPLVKPGLHLKLCIEIVATKLSQTRLPLLFSIFSPAAEFLILFCCHLKALVLFFLFLHIDVDSGLKGHLS